MKRFVRLRLALFFILGGSLIIGGCGGGGGSSSSDSSGANSALESTVEAKAQSLLPPDEYALFKQRLAVASNDPNYADSLSRLNQTFDGITSLIDSLSKKSVQQQAKRAFFTTASLFSLPSAYNQVKAALTNIFGDVMNDGKTAVLNAGMGFSRGLLGGDGLSLTAAVVAGGGVEIDSGVGIEEVYDFKHFESAVVPVSECGAGIEISIGEGGPSAEVHAVYYENWIFGFKQSIEKDYVGAAKGSSATGSLDGELGAGLGIEGGIGYWQGIDAPCTLSTCPATSSTTQSAVSGINYAVGVDLSVGSENAKGAVTGSVTSNCTGSPTKTNSFINTKDNPNIRYILAGFCMAEDILSTANGSPFNGFTLSGAAAAILYGFLSDDSSTNTGSNDYVEYGYVFYSNTPLSGIKVEIIEGNLNNAPNQSLPTDSSGYFFFSGFEFGKTYWLKVYGPSSEYVPYYAESFSHTQGNSWWWPHLNLPKVITLISPANNSIVSVSTPQFCWTGLPDASSYNLQIFSPSGGQPVVDENTSQTCYQISGGLANNTNYNWWVRVYDNHGYWIGSPSPFPSLFNFYYQQ